MSFRPQHVFANTEFVTSFNVIADYNGIAGARWSAVEFALCGSSTTLSTDCHTRTNEGHGLRPSDGRISRQLLRLRAT